MALHGTVLQNMAIVSSLMETLVWSWRFPSRAQDDLAGREDTNRLSCPCGR